MPHLDPAERRLISNADDLGLCPGVNRGVLQAARHGTVTSTSVFVGPDFSVELAPFVDAGLSLGLHLNLTQGSPCAPSCDVPSLVDGAGMLIPDRDVLFEQLVPSEAEHELRCQLGWFRKLADGDPTHLDTHKHLHSLNEPIFEIAASMARELDVPLRSQHDKARAACREAGVLTTEGFLGEVRPAPFWTIDRLREQLALAGPGTTELMCHPGVDMELVPGLWYLEHRETEAATFCSAQARELLSEFELCTFEDAPLKRP